MCRTWEKDPAHELTPSELASILRQMPRMTWLDLTGGEIFLRPDTEELVLAALDSCPSLRVLHFPTNGWFSRRVVETCVAVRRRKPDVELIVTVSIDGPPQIHDQIRGRAGSFDRALDTFRELRQIDGVQVYIGTTLTDAAEANLDVLGSELKARVPGFTDRDWHWNLVQRSGHFFGNDTPEPSNATAASQPATPPTAAGRGLLREHVRRRGLPRGLVDIMELIFLVNAEYTRRGDDSGIPCQALRSAAFVSPEGDLYPCHVYDRPLGNLREESVDAVWNSARVEEARADIEKLRCGGCFTPCEAYPAIAGAPREAIVQTLKRSARLLAAEIAARRDRPQRSESDGDARSESGRSSFSDRTILSSRREPRHLEVVSG